MSKVTIIKCSDYESNRLVEGIKNGTAEQEYQPFRGPGKVYEFELLRIDQPKKEVTIGGSPVELEPREFEILGLFASHPNEALPCDFFSQRDMAPPGHETWDQRSHRAGRKPKEKTSAGSIRHQLPDHRGKHAARTGVPI